MELAQAIFGWVIANQVALVEASWWILTGASMLAALTPTDADDKAIGRIKNLVGKLRK